ncbi:hypothetical protein GOP47_0001501 [Adiantum capillus-veneris]|uniref:Uncharacterized protein n=1 Tax=Adiantum capillus-veneris TaxID=13818 RepID=A0A9D4ZN45_ADICA|nr:hypothetical protein GOP47_0001501 [Adiantum capillus-veneris]
MLGCITFRSLILQVHSVRTSQENAKAGIGLLEAAMKIGKEEGWQGYWKGNLPQVIRLIPYSAIQLTSYELYKKLFKDEDKELSVVQRLAAGACAGMTSTLVTYPLDVFRLRLAVDPASKSMIQVATNMVREEGFLSFYSGLGPSLLGIAPYIALNFCAFDLIKNSLPEEIRKTPAASFLTALISSSLATTSCYPLDTIRRQMQMKGTPYKSVFDAFIVILANDGPIGLYRGFIPNALKSLPNSRGKKVTGVFIYRHIRQAIKEIGPSNVIQDILSQALSIVNFINKKVRVLAIYRTYFGLELKKPSPTRFAAMWLLLERLYDVQTNLQKTMVSDEFKAWIEEETQSSQQDAKAIQWLCLKEEFWQEVKGLVMVVLPLYKVLRMTDMEGSTIGLLYHFMEEAYKEIERSTILDGAPDGSRDVLEDSPKRDDILFLVKKRWDWMRRPIYGFAALLHPAFKKPSIFADQALQEECDKGTAFASSVCWKRDSLVKPLFWWECFGYQLPHLQRVALRVLGQDCSSGAYECKLSIETLKSLNKDRDPEEEQIFRDLYLELEEIDRRVSRTRSRKKRGSGSGSTMADTTLENVSISRPADPREPEFDDEGNILSEGDYGLASSASDASSDEDDAATSSSSSSSSSDHNSGDESDMST